MTNYIMGGKKIHKGFSRFRSRSLIRFGINIHYLKQILNTFPAAIFKAIAGFAGCTLETLKE